MRIGEVRRRGRRHNGRRKEDGPGEVELAKVPA